MSCYPCPWPGCGNCMIGRTYRVAPTSIPTSTGKRTRAVTPFDGHFVRVVLRGSWRREFKGSPHNVIVEATDGRRSVMPSYQRLGKP